MVVYGHDSTMPVTVDELIPLTAAVVRGTRRAMVVADLPFGSYQGSPQAALAAATRFLKEAGAHAVKLEGGSRVVRAGRGTGRRRHPGDGASGPDPAVSERLRRLQGSGPRRGRRAAAARRQGHAGRRRVRGGPGVRPGRAGRPGHRQPGHPDDRHRRRPGLRRPGAGLAGHGRADAAHRQVRQALRQRRQRAGRCRPGLRRRRQRPAPSPTRPTPTGSGGAHRRRRPEVLRRRCR